MNTPFCRGRFLEGVRTGRLAEDLELVFGRDTGSVYLRLTMADGPAPGVYAIGIEPLRINEPGRHREAMLTVDLRARAEVVDPSACEREPIRTPGSIQPPNALMAVGLDTFVIEVASENAAAFLGRSDEAILGRPLDDLLPAAFVARLKADLSAASIPAGPPERYDADLGVPPRPAAIMVHRQDGRLVVEIEAAPVRPEDFGAPSAAALKGAVRELRRQVSLADLCASAARVARDFTGYERVLVYRFDADWNGESIAESIVPDWDETLLGLRFPASDIPRQARELYTRSPARFVIDRDATAVPLIVPPAENRPVDLTFAVFRSLSPVHIEYQRNLGVNGSMSIAITIDGRLWGLLIGHHRRPHYVAPETRDSLSVLVDTLALQIGAIEKRSLAASQGAHLSAQIALMQQAAAADDVVEALLGGRTKLTDLFGATGAAVVIGRTASTVGEAPGVETVLRLVDRLRTLPPGPLGFDTDHIAGFAPDLDLDPDVTSGLLAAFSDEERHGLLLWFRPQHVRRIVWGGDPSKPVMADARTAALLPRRSFERWVEERRGYAPPWAAWELEIAEGLAQAVEGMTLRASRRVRELSAKQDELLAVLAQKDLLTREIDHRVKNSLQIVSAFLNMQARQVQDPDAKIAFSETYARVMSIARVHDSLYQSENVTEVDLGQTIENLCRDLAGVGGEKRELDLKAERGLMVPYRKAVALSLIATELVTNAWKYAYPDQGTGAVEVLVGRDGEGGLRLRVCDQGEGLPAGWDKSRQGLGMKLIRAMLTQIDATMDVESETGTCFTVRC